MLPCSKPEQPWKLSAGFCWWSSMILLIPPKWGFWLEILTCSSYECISEWRGNLSWNHSCLTCWLLEQTTVPCDPNLSNKQRKWICFLFLTFCYVCIVQDCPDAVFRDLNPARFSILPVIKAQNPIFPGESSIRLVGQKPRLDCFLWHLCLDSAGPVLLRKISLNV